MGSPGLHLQQLTLVTSSPGHIKHSGFPLAAHQAVQLCPSSVSRHCPAEVGTVALLGMGWQWHRAAKLLSCPSALSRHFWRYRESRECRTLHQAGQTCAPGETLAKGKDPKRVEVPSLWRFFSLFIKQRWS